MKKLSTLSCLVFSLLLALPSLIAAPIDWGGAASGTFSDPAVWVGGEVPGAGDTANITGTGEIEINFTTDATLTPGGVLTFTVTEQAGDPVVMPKLTLNLDGNSIAVASPTFNPASATVSRTLVIKGDGSALSVPGVNTFDYGGLLSVNGAGSASILLENGARLIGSQSYLGDVRVASTQLMDVSGGSLWGATRSRLGYERLTTSTVNVTGAGSRFENDSASSSNYIWVGTDGSAVVNVSAGGTIASDSFMVIGGDRLNTTGYGELNMAGVGSTIEVARGLYIGVRVTNDSNPLPDVISGNGLLNLTDGATGTLGLLNVMAGNPAEDRIGRVSLDGSVELTVGDAIFHTDSVLRIGIGSLSQAENLIVTGDLDITGALLEGFLTNDFIPSLGQGFSLIEYGDLIGTFANESGLVQIGGHVFAIDYNFDGQNMIGLTVIPEPGTAALLFGCTILLLAMLRRRES